MIWGLYYEGIPVWIYQNGALNVDSNLWSFHQINSSNIERPEMASSMELQYILNPRTPVQVITPAASPLQNTPTPPSPPLASTSKRIIALLTRDQRLQIRTLRPIKWTRKDIVEYLEAQEIDCTERQVQLAKKIRPYSQNHCCDSKVLLNTSARRRNVVIIIEDSKRARRMSYIEISEKLQLFVSERREAMRKGEIFKIDQT